MDRRNQIEPCENNILIILTDGEPNEGAEAAAEYVRLIHDQTNYIIMGYGVGPGTDSTNISYPQMPKELKILIAQALTAKSAQDRFRRGVGGKKFTPDMISNSFTNVADFTAALPTILDFALKNPQAIRDQSRRK
jgi:hypothetical protein